jgi:hypothetical protein
VVQDSERNKHYKFQEPEHALVPSDYLLVVLAQLNHLRTSSSSYSLEVAALLRSMEFVVVVPELG